MTGSSEPPEPDQLPADVLAARTLRFQITVAAEEMIAVLRRMARHADEIGARLVSPETRLWRMRVRDARWRVCPPTDGMDDATWWRFRAQAEAVHYAAQCGGTARPSTAVAVRR